MTFGVALYRDLGLLQRAWANEIEEEEHIARTEALSVSFDPADETPEEDVAAAEEHGWPVAGPDALSGAQRSKGSKSTNGTGPPR